MQYGYTIKLTMAITLKKGVGLEQQRRQTSFADGIIFSAADRDTEVIVKKL